MRLIDADALNKAFDKSEAIEEIYGSDGLPVISEVIDAAPTIDAEPVRQGKWEDWGEGYASCSECGETTPWMYASNYCGHCGVEMRGDEHV